VTDYLTSVLRTLVPTLWGAGLAWAVAWLLTHGVPAELVDTLQPLQPVGTMVLVPASVTAVYAGARWLEARPWMPTWLSRVLLGSAKQPVYVTHRAAVEVPGRMLEFGHELTQAEADERRRRWLAEHGRAEG